MEKSKCYNLLTRQRSGVTSIASKKEKTVSITKVITMTIFLIISLFSIELRAFNGASEQINFYTTPATSRKLNDL